jgi:hypothetical protein
MAFFIYYAVLLCRTTGKDKSERPWKEEVMAFLRSHDKLSQEVHKILRIAGFRFRIQNGF